MRVSVYTVDPTSSSYYRSYFGHSLNFPSMVCAPSSRGMYSMLGTTWDLTSFQIARCYEHRIHDRM